AVFPPLWGEGSYNWGAGMHRINTSAGFIWANMPLGQPGTLTEQQAWDVAAFINSHPRPADPRSAGATEETDASFHSHDCSYGDSVGGDVLGGS
ncbi:MAG: thiosulfate dehydrogenase, partial [Myxococcota bacterium]